MPRLLSNTVPVGTVVDFGGGTVPNGFLPCDGSLVSRTTYSELFQTIGDKYGVGDGVSTFGIPDFRGRVAVGSGQGTGLSLRARGDSFGVESVSLTTNQIPSHNHSVGVTVSAATSGGGSHNHTIAAANTSQTDFGSGKFVGGNDGSEATGLTVDSTGSGHTHTINVTTNVAQSSVGSGAAHTNMQPSLVVTKMIRF